MAATSKTDPACPGPRSHQGTPNRGAGARLGAVPGSDFLSPLQLPPESGACPPGSRGHSNRPGRGLRLLGPVPAISGLPTAAQHAANGPGLPGVAHGQQPRLLPQQVWSLILGGQQVVWGSVWRPSHSHREGWFWTECPHRACPQSRTPPTAL